MIPRIILCRHGNTFQDGEKVVMVGAKEDLPLTEKGRAQVAAVGHALKKSGVTLDAIYTGPLQRTVESARIISGIAAEDARPIVDTRLTELDYGEWGGLSDTEISARWGVEVLEAWHTRGVRPSTVTFTPSEEHLEKDAQAMLHDFSAHQGYVLVVTSNGRLRQFGRAVGADSSQSWKVRTGRSCVLERKAGSWSVVAWDCEPEQLERVLEQCG